MELHEWAQQPDSFRDTDWEQHFLNALVMGHIDLQQEQPQAGPDGWPYMLVKTSPSAQEPTRSLLYWLSENGVGLVVNSHKELPDYVFTYGMIWNFRENGHFLSADSNELKSGDMEYRAGQEVLAGDAQETYLPKYVRAVLRRFLTDQGLSDPKILVIGTEASQFDLVFSLESLGNPPKEEHSGILEALSWFLPLNYSLVIAPEKGLPPFHAL